MCVQGIQRGSDFLSLSTRLQSSDLHSRKGTAVFSYGGDPTPLGNPPPLLLLNFYNNRGFIQKGVEPWAMGYPP